MSNTNTTNTEANAVEVVYAIPADKSLDINIELNGKIYRITRDKCGGYLKVRGTRQQYDLTSNFPIAQFIERSIRIDEHGRLGKRILKKLAQENPSVFQLA
jgi:hypothetical protein